MLQAESLPTNPDSQREQLVRRLAARDDSIDLIGMDVVWTGEFAQAGWITPFEQGELENVGSEEQVLKGPFASAQYDDQQYGAPLNSNTRLLWYRKSVLGDRPVPKTWDELIDTAEALDATSRRRASAPRPWSSSSTRSWRAPGARSSSPATAARPSWRCRRARRCARSR